MMWLREAQARFDKRFFPEKSRRWRRWKQHDPAAADPIPHASWDHFVASYVIDGGLESNRLAYGRVAEADKAALESYLAACAATPISRFNRDEQLAFWVNLYNALTVKTVLDHYPVRSLRNIGLVPSWLGGGPWDSKRIAVEGEELSLNDIEHRILRRNWRNPLIHYVINCAALGCPSLRQRAYTGTAIGAQMEEAARRFVNSPGGVRFIGERLSVCRIYEWFQVDFGASDADVLAHIRGHAAPDLAARLERHGGIDLYHYDWSLNDSGKP